jgi:hypothetical protein
MRSAASSRRGRPTRTWATCRSSSTIRDSHDQNEARIVHRPRSTCGGVGGLAVWLVGDAAAGAGGGGENAAADARVDVYTANFGNASRNLEHAKAPLQAARITLQSSGPDGAVAKIDEAILRATEAQQLASKFNQDANGRAGQASQLIDEVLQATR